MCLVLLYWAAAVRGRDLPAFLNEYCVRPEQSNLFGPAAPYLYSEPFLEAAIWSAFVDGAIAAASVATPGDHQAAADGGEGESRGRTGTGHQRRDTIERRHAKPFVSRL